MISVNSRIRIPEEEIEELFVRSSGPGGQNVNKVATAVQLRFNAMRSASIPEHVKSRLSAIAGKRMTEEGLIIIDSRTYRTQERNREEARRRLAELIGKAALRPRARKPTAPSRAARQNRREKKKQQSEKKRLRSKPLPPE
jgi:ribosome-associated protein